MLYKHKICCLILGLATAAALCPVALAEQEAFSVGAKRTPKYTGEDSGTCLRCHSGEKMHAIAASPHGKLDKPDSPLPSRGCESCHGPGSFHVSRAHGGRGFPRMITFGRGSSVASREQQLEACLACHEEGIGEIDAIIWWGSIHDRGNFNCSSCHLIHTEFDPIKEKEQQDKTCFRCHRKQKTGHPKFEDKSIDFDALSCWTCHDVHNTLKAKEPLDSNQDQQ
jgi:DmsE family decaheme c-type cytochrome